MLLKLLNATGDKPVANKSPPVDCSLANSPRSSPCAEFIQRCRDCAGAGMYSLENFVQPLIFASGRYEINAAACPDHPQTIEIAKNLAGKTL